MLIKNAEHLFERQISLLNNAEEQLTKSLPEWIEATDRKAVSKAFKHKLEATQEHMERLEKAIETVEDIRLKRLKDHAFAALVDDADETIETTAPGSIRDAAMLSVLRKIERYEIVAYESLRSLAKQLGYSKLRDILKETLTEKRATDDKFKELLKKKVNPVKD